MRLIAITPPYFYPDEAKAIEKALNGGFERVHIRKPQATAAELGRLISEVPRALRPRLSLHDHHELAQELGVGGIHLNRRNPDAPREWHGIVSRSIHSPHEAAQACNGTTAHYLLASPVFPSFSKAGYTPEFSLDQWQAHQNQRLVALGGVCHANLPDLQAAGFTAAAMLTEAWRKPLDMDAFRLQFITNPTQSQSASCQAAKALDGGCRWIQLRHKEADLSTLRREIEALHRLCEPYGATLVADDHPELAGEGMAAGLHVGKTDIAPSLARLTVGPQTIIGATVNSCADLMVAATEGADYIGAGPFRFTTTKKNLSPVLGIEGYRQLVDYRRTHSLRMPIVAIGGITEADIPAIAATGVEGIAVSGTIINSSDPTATTGRLLHILSQSYQQK